MSRIHLIEFNDAPWTPAPLRRTVVEFLHHMATKLEMYRPGFERIDRLLKDCSTNTVQLLCAGGGGGAQELARALAPDVRIVLSDRYPDIPAYRALAQAEPKISAVHESVDVRDLPAAMAGLRVIVNAAHHLRPEELKEVLADAVAKRQPIMLIEPVQREFLPVLRFTVVAPLLCLLMSLGWIRPLSARRTLLGALLPLGTVAFLFDGIVSHLRAYTFEEWRAYVAEPTVGSGFRWSTEQLPGALGSKLNVLVGVPEMHA